MIAEPPREKRLLAITMTSYRRPKYSGRVLEALSRCEGVADWVLLSQIDPAPSAEVADQVVDHFERFDACEQLRIVNDERRGLNLNTQQVLVRAMNMRPDVVLHIEDDTVPSPDALRYFDWAVSDVLRSSGDDLVLASGYHKQRPPGPDLEHATATRPIWSPWGWAVDRKRLIWILSKWCTKNPKCFTCRIKQQFKRTRREVYPLLSRIQNIGYQKGENDRSPDWYRDNHRCDQVAGILPERPFTAPRSP